MRLRLNILEEVKSQLGEQLPGSLEAIRKAVSKFYKKDISTSEMFQLMKDGKLLAKDILPLLGEEFSKMAKTGDALKFALLSLSTVQQRMNTSFREWINNVYKGGLAEGLSELYKTLDKMFFLMSQGDSGAGKFLKGFIDSARKSIIWVHDTLLDIYYLITEDLGLKGVDMELLGKVAYWATILGLMNSIAGVMKVIFGGKMIEMIAAATARLLGFGAAVTTTTTATGVAAGAGAGLLAGLKSMGGRIALAAGAYALYDWFANPHTAEGLQSGVDQLGFGNKPKLSSTSIFQDGFAGGQPNFLQNANGMLQNQQAKVLIKLETTSDVDKLIQGHIETNNQRVIQSVLPAGWIGTSK